MVNTTAQMGNQADSSYRPNWSTYKHHSAALAAAE